MYFLSCQLRQSAVGRVSRAGRQYKGRKVQGGGGVDDESTSKEKYVHACIAENRIEFEKVLLKSVINCTLCD